MALGTSAADEPRQISPRPSCGVDPLQVDRPSHIVSHVVHNVARGIVSISATPARPRDVALFVRLPGLRAEIVRSLCAHEHYFAAGVSDPRIGPFSTSALVAGFPELSPANMRALRALTVHCLAGPPIILVTRPNPANLRQVAQIQLHDAITIERIPDDLSAAVEAAQSAGPLRRLRAEIPLVRAVPDALRRALLHALSADLPIRFTGSLAHAVGSSAATLERQWRNLCLINAERDSQPALSQILREIALLRCAVLVNPTRSWERAATAQGLSVRWVRRAARRIYGLGLAELLIRRDELMVRWEGRMSTLLRCRSLVGDE